MLPRLKPAEDNGVEIDGVGLAGAADVVGGVWLRPLK